MLKKTILLILISLFTLFFISCGTESTPVYTLTTSVNGEGTISPSSGEFEEGEEVTLTGTPSEGWVFESWSGDGSGSSNSITITMDSNKSVNGNFKRRDYPLTITIEGEGTVQEQVISQPKTTDYPFETVVELTPNPSDGWEFVEWGGDVSSKDEVIDVTLDGEVNVTVTFERIDYPLTITIEGEGIVEQEVVQSKTTEYPFETVVQLTPIPSEGWYFDEWGGDLSGSEESITITISKDKNVSVKFSPIVYLGDNGITIMCPNGKVGEIGIVNEVEYEVVDRRLLNQRINEGRGGLDRKVCVSLITDMNRLFEDSGFNEPIGDWDVSNVRDMNNMFRNGIFDQPIGNWDVSNVTNMREMFYISPFNQPIGDWDVSNVRDMRNMFRNTLFNQPIGGWNVSSVNDMLAMFYNNWSFNQSIGDWDVSNVRNMRHMFGNATAFNQPLENWDVSSVTDMKELFMNTPFNQPIGNWDVSNVIDMTTMFAHSDFNKNISGWCVWRFKSEPRDFSKNSPLTEENKPLWGTCPD